MIFRWPNEFYFSKSIVLVYMWPYYVEVIYRKDMVDIFVNEQENLEGK